jgi:MFS family permease
MKGLLPDLSLLGRRREFRLGLTARGISLLGSEFAIVAIPFQVYELTGSAFAVGAVGLVESVPLVVVALYAGALADAVDRRRMVVIAELGGAVVALALLLNTALADPMLWLMYVGAGAGVACYALLRPPMDAIIPRTVEPHELTAAVGFEGIQFNLTAVVGPALAGVVLAATSVPVLFAVDLATFAISAALLARLPSYAPAEPRQVRPWADIREGFAYARSRQELVGSYVVDLVAMIFALPSALFAALAPELGGPSALGLLYAAPAVGALVVSALSGPARNVRRHGRAIVLAAAGWGVAIALFGLVDALVPALVLLAIAGGFDAVSAMFRFTLWNQTIPDGLRGRLAGLEMVSWGAGPGLGDLEAGAVASLTSVRTSIVSGGVLCVAGCAVTAAALPALWRYEAPRGSAPGEAAASAAGTPS